MLKLFAITVPAQRTPLLGSTRLRRIAASAGFVLVNVWLVYHLAGIVIAIPTILLVAKLGSDVGAKVLLPWWLWVGAVCITMAMALLSGLLALRSLRMVEPVTLLR